MSIPTDPNPAPMQWAPVNDFDNFNANPYTYDPYGITLPSYEINGQWPAVTGIPSTNPATLCVKLCRIIGPGASDGTWQVRTQEGWLLDNFVPHTSDTPEQGMFLQVLFCGQWCMDLAFDTYLPSAPVAPSTYVEPA